MLHAESTSKRRVCFDHDIVFVAVGGDIRSSIKRVDFDLIDGGQNAGF